MAPAQDNRNPVRDLFTTGRLRVAADPAELEPPDTSPVAWDRAAGMVTGLAVGDALGNTSESLVPSERRRQHGEIRDYLPNRYADGRRVLEQLEPRLAGVQRIVILAGMRYREFLVPRLSTLGHRIEVPLEGLPIGKQLQWFALRERDRT